MSQRTYQSGSYKRKLKLLKENSNKKIAGSILKYAVTCSGSETFVSDDAIVSPSQCADSSFKKSDGCASQSCECNNSDEAGSVSEYYADVDNCGKHNNGEPEELTNDSLCFDSDPSVWTDITDEMIEVFLKNPPSQNLDIVSDTERICGGKKRTLTEGNFYHVKKNGEKVLRKWLVLSRSTKQLFCWVCKCFNSTSSSKTQLNTGFDDWKHASNRLREHENSTLHKLAMMDMSQRMKKSQRIDSALIIQREEEINYWIAVLRRVVATVKFLSSRNLPFFGDDETIGSKHNGCFLGCLELISQFDPFLAAHLEKYGNPGRGNVNYLSSTSIHQFIDIMAKKVLNYITNEILCAKYFSVIVDSTPDVTHIDQLCLVIRYINQAEIVERFLKFIPIYSHKAESLAGTVLTTLEDLGIDIQNCRGQSYDNASNMAGKYSGLQARIKNKNPLADFVPCSAHSLNLVGTNAVESCSGAIQFFSLVQQIYTFFSISTHRWKCLLEEMKKNGSKITLKNRCETRWCANGDAVKALNKNYTSILNTLSALAADAEQHASTKSEATALAKRLKKFENVVNIVVWNTLLQRLNQTSTEIQNPSLNLSVIAPLFQSLIDFIQYVRDNFSQYEDQAKQICGQDATYSEVRKKSVPRSKEPDVVDTTEVQMTAREAYIFKIHYAVCDALLSCLTQRKVTYMDTTKKFACFFNIKCTSKLKEDSAVLQSSYPLDLDECFSDELIQFSSLVENDDSVPQMLEKLKSLHLEDTFPNVETALRIFLTLPVSNCSGERSFSVLKRLKSPVRSTLLQNRLSSLALLCIEGDIAEKLDFEDIIHEFAHMKMRKKTII